MSASKTMTDFSFGFMTVADLGSAVLIGGYLVLNCLGRPLEFHCTEPVKPNRAQEILYGPTLRSFLCGEQIGQALLRHCQIETELILTDSDAVLSLRDFTDTPVLCVASAAHAALDTAPPRTAANPSEAPAKGSGSHGQVTENPSAYVSRLSVRELECARTTLRPAAEDPRWHSFLLGDNQVYISTRYVEDQPRAERIYREKISDWDLAEPFQRISEAVGELQKAA
jgi:hypothetical protein